MDMNELFIRWLGQGGFEFKHNGVSIIAVDPYLSDLVNRRDGLKRLIPPPVNPRDFTTSLCVITHDHIDHLDSDTIAVMKKDRFACPPSCVDQLVSLGAEREKITVLRSSDMESETNDLDKSGLTVKIKAVYADHTPDSIGIVLDIDNKRIYFTGDTLYNENVGANVNCDIIFCCINGRWGNMNHDEAVKVAVRSGAEAAVPNHYGMFAENTADPEDFVNAASKTNLHTFIMQPAVWYPLSVFDVTVSNAVTYL